MDIKKEFTRAFGSLCQRHNKGRAFASFAEIAACTAHQVPYHQGALARDGDFERVENLYLDAVRGYDRDELDATARMYGLAAIGLHEDRDDFLGKMFMDLEICNEQRGQFFTPPALQRMLAEMTLTDVGATIKAKGCVSISEPACGAGGMLIEAANAIQRQGFDPRRTMWFQAVDVDRTCFNMAYFQLATLGLAGEVVHGNTLSMEQWEVRATPQMKLSLSLTPPAAKEKRVSLDDLRAATDDVSKADETKPVRKQLELDLGR